MSRYDEQLAELRAFGETLTQPLEPGSQGSADWFRARCGKITASRFKDVVGKRKDGKAYLAGREDYLWEIVVERLTGKPAEHYASVAMQHGTDNEAGARMAYEAATGALVEQVGFIIHPELPYVGGSPDGLVGDDGGTEFKCPFDSAIHLQTILDGMPEGHKPQVQGLMWITKRTWWDFDSHDPRLPKPFDNYIQRAAIDLEYTAMLKAEIEKFEAEVQDTLNRLKEKQA